MMQQTDRNAEREAWVDWLRVLACLLVMVVHSSEPFYLDGYDTLILTDADLIWASAIDSASRMSVPLFVIASSYLLFPLRYSVGEFFRRRAVRILIPFFIWSNGYRETFGVSTLGQLDLRYGFGRKNYITVRGGVFSDIYSLDTFSAEDMMWGVGAEYARKTLVGPLKIAAQWGREFGASVYASIGFDF